MVAILAFLASNAGQWLDIIASCTAAAYLSKHQERAGVTRQQNGIVGIARRKSASLGLGITVSAQSGASLALDDCMVCFSVHCRCQSG